MSKDRMMAHELFEALKAAGLADDDTRRVVLDVGVSEPVVAYIERYADKRVLKVVTALDGTRIDRIEEEGG